MATDSGKQGTIEENVIPEKRVLVERLPVDDQGAMLGLVKFNRPRDMNPMDWETNLEIEKACDELAADPAVRVIAITGTGKAFSAGGNLKKYVALQKDPQAFPQFVEDIQRIFRKLGQYPKPVIALVNGIAVAGGFELILFCDLAIMAESARIGDYHLTYGMMGGGGVLAYLRVAVGPARARELMFSGRLLSSAEAVSWGLVSKVVPDDQLIEAGKAFAAEVAKKSPLGIANVKSVINMGIWNSNAVEDMMRIERELNNRYCLTSYDAQEGLRAFSEKRRPVFEGR